MDYEIVYKEGKQQVIPDAFLHIADYKTDYKNPSQIMIPENHFVTTISTNVPTFVSDNYINSTNTTPGDWLDKILQTKIKLQKV